MRRVLLDCNGVLAAFVDGWLKLINAQWGTTYAVDDVTDWDVLGSLGVHPDRHSEAKKMIAACPGFAGKLEVLPGAIDGVRRIQEIAEVDIVTSPWNSHPTWTSDREAWLKRNFGIPHSRVHHTSAKHRFTGDVLIDDKTSTCEEWRAAHLGGIAVLWATPHNRRDLWDGMCTSSWDFLVDVVRGLP